jgi:hypothetical protein
MESVRMSPKKPGKARSPDKLIKSGKNAGQLSEAQLGQAKGGSKHIGNTKYDPTTL